MKHATTRCRIAALLAVAAAAALAFGTSNTRAADDALHPIDDRLFESTDERHKDWIDLEARRRPSTRPAVRAMPVVVRSTAH
jgi:hypothetical protein